MSLPAKEGATEKAKTVAAISLIETVFLVMAVSSVSCRSSA
jgi:hypothetical protein